MQKKLMALGCLAGGVLVAVLMAGPFTKKEMPAQQQATSADQIIATAAPAQSALEKRQPAQIKANPQSTQPTDSSIPWQANEWESTLNEDGLSYFKTSTPPQYFANLTTGQTLRLPLPEQDSDFSVTLSEARKGYGDLDIVSGDVPGTTQGVTIVKGKLDTHMTVITANTTYTVVVDNQTGETKIIDDRDRAKLQFIDGKDGLEHHQQEKQIPFPPGLKQAPISNAS
ncbi:hypothetical protein H0A36_05965 [Endozoicomonas sp. SM1973]|uniref:Uncharacterized protein n=1 Tax=Spartinivicinus marinus TaxID=2994442 RepID=A0A853HUV9_9GAMM|nr:hypothetical protein [Spartinivicinus marinus]MCX4028867.1 hypothetical protein [Spartinivicinus marinus]NYZ65550.1 hypothetical protein [Spartinivicinus marinus]